MKKLLLIIILSLSLILTPSVAFAQGMMGGWIGTASGIGPDNHTAQEEVEGKEIWDKLQLKQLKCKSLTDDNFDALGEYFMGQSIGNTERHAVMNQMMVNMMGEKGETQIHITLGKRSSGCDVNASLPTGYNFMPMMWMMGGGDNPMMGYGGWGNMMNGWGGFGIIGWLFMIIFWTLIILGVVALVRYLARAGRDNIDKDKTPLDILKERYANGEINKKEFKDMKKDLS